MKLGNLCDVVRGSSPRPQGDPKYYGGSVPRLMIADVTRDGMYVTPQIDSLTEEGAMKSRPMKKGDVIIAVSGDPGRACILNVDACIHDGFVGLRNLDASQIYKPYLLNYLSYFKNTTKKGAVGAIFQNLTTDQIKKIEIPEISLEDQIRIANILSKAEALISQRKEGIRLLDEFLKSTFLEMFGDPVRNEKGWEKIKMDDVVLRLDTGKSIQSVEKTEAGEFKVLKTSSVSWGRFKKEESKWLPKDYCPPNDHLVEKGNILMSRMNTTELVGASAYVFDDVKNLALPDRIWKFILSKEKPINPLFLWYCINWDSFRKVISEISSGTSGSMKNITKGGILKLPLIYPEYKLQIQFAEIVEKTEIMKAHYQSSLQEFENLYGSLSQRAFKGKLNVTSVQLLMAAESKGTYGK